MGLPIAHRRFTLHYVQRVSAVGIHWQPLLGNQPFLTVKQKVSPKKNHMKLLTLPSKPISGVPPPQLHPKTSPRELHLLNSTQSLISEDQSFFTGKQNVSHCETKSFTQKNHMKLLTLPQKPYLGSFIFLSPIPQPTKKGLLTEALFQIQSLPLETSILDISHKSKQKRGLPLVALNKYLPITKH